MTITEAFELLINTTAFKDIAKKKDDKQGSHYRMLKSRYNKGTLKNAAMVDVLEFHGFTFTVKKP